MANPGGINTGPVWGRPKVTVTAKTELLHHLVSDEELEALSTMKRNWTLEAIWACVGVFAGTAKGTISAMIDAYGTQPPIPLSLGDVIEIVMFFAAALVGIALFSVNKSGITGTRDLVNEIRNRERVQG